MIVNLTDKYFVKVEKLDYMLCQKGVSKKGEPTEKTIGYYANMPEVIMAVIRDERADGKDCGSLEEFYNQILDYDKALLRQVNDSYKDWKIKYTPKKKKEDEDEIL